MKKDHKMLSSDQCKLISSIFFLFVVSALIFLHTVEMRKPWRTELSTGNHQWLSGSTIKFTNNWYREGPLSLKFGLIENPKSIEFPTLLSRDPYASYPPGTIIPLYVLAKILKNELTPSILMKYNLFNQFFIAFFLSLTVFVFLRQIQFDYFNSVSLSIVPILIVLFTPATMYWHQNVYFSDQAIILPFVLFIFLEVLKKNILRKNTFYSICIMQTLVMFYGALTDWFFVIIAFVVWVNRILNREMGNNLYCFVKTSLIFWFPILLAIILFVVQLYSLGVLTEPVNKFLIRTGMSTEGSLYIQSFFKQFWLTHIRIAFGKPAIFLLWGSLFLFLMGIFSTIRRKSTHCKEKLETKILLFMSYFIVPCFLQIYLFRNHSVIHDFSALKFSITLAVIPFVVAPILVLSILNVHVTKIYLKGISLIHNKTKIDIKIYVLSLMLFIVIFAVLSKDASYYTKFFPKPNIEYKKIGNFISRNTTYKDVVFSTIYEAPKNPPQQLSYTMKRIYKIRNLNDIYEKVKYIKDNYDIILFIPKKDGLKKFLKELEPLVFQTISNDKYSIFKINGMKFINKYAKQRNMGSFNFQSNEKRNNNYSARKK